MLASSTGEDDGQGSRTLGALSSIVGKASEGEVPCKQSILSGVAGKANMEKGEIVCLITSEATRAKNTHKRCNGLTMAT